MINRGLVKEVNGEVLKVQLYKESACSHCSGCNKEEKPGSVYNFRCSEGIEVGDTITFEIKDNSLLKIVALIYLTPVFSMIGGYFVGEMVGLSEMIKVVLSFTGFLGAFLFIHLYDSFRGHEIIEREIRIKGSEKISEYKLCRS